MHEYYDLETKYVNIFIPRAALKIFPLTKSVLTGTRVCKSTGIHFYITDHGQIKDQGRCGPSHAGFGYYSITKEPFNQSP